jgi:hypothetical protein
MLLLLLLLLLLLGCQLPLMLMPQIQTFPEIMMFTDFAESGLVLKARPM